MLRRLFAVSLSLLVASAAPMADAAPRTADLLTFRTDLGNSYKCDRAFAHCAFDRLVNYPTTGKVSVNGQTIILEEDEMTNRGTLRGVLQCQYRFGPPQAVSGGTATCRFDYVNDLLTVYTDSVSSDGEHWREVFSFNTKTGQCDDASRLLNKNAYSEIRFMARCKLL